MALYFHFRRFWTKFSENNYNFMNISIIKTPYNTDVSYINLSNKEYNWTKWSETIQKYPKNTLHIIYGQFYFKPTYRPLE